jgi:hypothetical protein
MELFKQFGEILKIGLHHVVVGGWFTGKGFVTLNKNKSEKYLDLAPQIPS